MSNLFSPVYTACAELSNRLGRFYPKQILQIGTFTKKKKLFSAISTIDSPPASDYTVIRKL